MSATLSCPEITRLALFENVDPISLQEVTAERLPAEIKDYMPKGVDAAQGLNVHKAFLAAVYADNASAERVMARFISVAHSFAYLPVSSWAEAVDFYLSTVDSRLTPPSVMPADPFNVLHALAGMAISTRSWQSPRLSATISSMEKAFAATLDWNACSITLLQDSWPRYLALRNTWREKFAAHYDPVLKRWLQFQLTSTLFPFAGLGANHLERVTLLGVRFATFKLALMCECVNAGNILPQETVIRIAQSLARVLDHIGDSSFILKAYTEAGWTQENRLRGLLE